MLDLDLTANLMALDDNNIVAICQDGWGNDVGFIAQSPREILLIGYSTH
jgi:hypothetical protein